MQENELTDQQKKDVYAMAARTVTRDPLKIEIQVKPHSWLDRLLIKYKIKKSKVNYELRPLLVGNRYRASARALNIPSDFLRSDIQKALMASSSIEDLIYIVGVGIQNNDKEPTKELLRFIRFQFDDTDIFKVLDAVFAQIDLSSFIRSIILLKGQEVLTPEDPETLETTNQ